MACRQGMLFKATSVYYTFVGRENFFIEIRTWHNIIIDMLTVWIAVYLSGVTSIDHQAAVFLRCELCPDDFWHACSARRQTGR